MDGWVDINWAQISLTDIVYNYLQDCNKHIDQMSHMLLWERREYIDICVVNLYRKQDKSLLRGNI